MSDLSVVGWLGLFALSGLVVALAGVELARDGDEIAERTGLGGLFVGSLLLAGATSLPEVATDVSAGLTGNPDIAVGDLFGSSMANMAILGLLDLVHRRRVWPRVGLGHARVAAIAIGLTAIALLGILVRPGHRIGWIGLEPLLIVALYVAAMAWIRRTRPGRTSERGESQHESATRPSRPTPPAPAEPTPGDELLLPTGWAEVPGRPLAVTVGRFGLASLAVLFAAPLLAVSAGELAAATGLGQTFVGTFLVAATTSAPELVASLAAVRIGAHDLAVGNLFGSNAFNMLALLAADLAYTGGPILDAVSPGQAVAGVGAILLMAIALTAIVHGAETRLRRLEPDAVLLLASYVVLATLVWSATRPG
ncbi:MAG TPA: sodium:calcium antiporter [Candidatus Binatia bacterium]|nr:sodium:calcium antiporter [Candidatus Binatia bacterium]